MTRMTGPNCAVMCNFINTYAHKHLPPPHTHTRARGVGEMCVEVVPRVQPILSRALHARRGKKVLQNLQNLDNTTMKRAMVRFRGALEKAIMTCLKYLELPQEETIESPLFREILGKSLRQQDAAEFVGRMCHGNGFRQETTAPTIYPARRRDGALSSTSECSPRH